MSSDPHPFYGQSSIYSPMPLNVALSQMFNYAKVYLEDEGLEQEVEELDALFAQVNEFWLSIFNELSGKSKP